MFYESVQTEHTLVLIKPHIYREKKTGDVISMIEKSDFIIERMELIDLLEEDVEEFYSEHMGKPFFKKLCDTMSSGPVVALLITSNNRTDVVGDFRKFIGSTNPAEAAPKTVRAIFGKSIDENAIHASDSPESASREIEFFFSSTCDSDSCDYEVDERCCRSGNCCN